MFKQGDKVRIKPGVIGAGQTGTVEKLWEHSNVYGTVPMYVVNIEDGVTAKFTPDLLEKLPKPRKWRTIDEE